MCHAFSCIVPETGSVIWKFGVDGHEKIIEDAGFGDRTNDPKHMKFARVEITPDNGSYLAPDRWTLKIDEQIKPRWWNPAYEAEAMDAHKQWLRKLNRILVKKPIVHPFNDVTPSKKVTKRHLALLKQWDSVRASVWDSVRASVGASVLASVWASVLASVWASAWAYSGSFFHLPRKSWLYTENIAGSGYPFQPLVDLLEDGLVPSFDGTTWRLHAGKDAKVVWGGKI
jgi:hypothetical protein